MLSLSISNAKKDPNIYKKIQWNIVENSELAAGNIIIAPSLKIRSIMKRA
jgi:hypothetical protein